jgi:hypothetical protein
MPLRFWMPDQVRQDVQKFGILLDISSWLWAFKLTCLNKGNAIKEIPESISFKTSMFCTVVAELINDDHEDRRLP